MKTDALFNDFRRRKNIKILVVNGNVRTQFENRYYNLQDKLFFEVIQNCGGIIIDNWIRLYGCGELNVIDKNEIMKNRYNFDIIIGEDIIGGLFALKDNVVYYFAPDTLKWECLNVYYANFLNWLINDSQNVDLFYRNYRWSNWKEEIKNLHINQGDIEDRSRRIINVDEIIKMNMEL